MELGNSNVGPSSLGSEVLYEASSSSKSPIYNYNNSSSILNSNLNEKSIDKRSSTTECELDSKDITQLASQIQVYFLLIIFDFSDWKRYTTNF